MRVAVWCIGVTFACLMGSVPAEARVFFTGSNPALSSFVFPQDNLLIPGGDNISFYTSWQSSPWWGDLDEPENKPNNAYVLSGARNEELQYKASIAQFDNNVSVSRWLSSRKKLRFDLKYSTQKMDAEANGENEGTAYSYRGRSAIRELYLASALATYYKAIPVGIKLGIGGVATSRPHIEHLLLNGSSVTGSQRALWGWNGSSTNAQGYFNAGNPLKFDLQTAATFGEHKVGTRFRYYAGKMLHYHDYTDSAGAYDIDPMNIHNYTFRLYGIYNWYKQQKFRFNTTALTRFTVLDSIKEAQGDRSLPEHVARAKAFVFQVNPNVNIYPWKYPMTYIDAAILCNYQYTRYDYRNNGEYMYTGLPWNIEEVSGEPFSYGNENFFEMALDIFASIPLYGRKDQMAALGVSLLVWRRYKFFNKYYGHMSGDDFESAGMRKSFHKEMWLNTFIGLVYRKGKVMYRLDFGQPLIYSLTPYTALYNSDGNQVRTFGKEKMWLAQSGYKVGFFVSTGLSNVIRYKPFTRPD